MKILRKRTAAAVLAILVSAGCAAGAAAEYRSTTPTDTPADAKGSGNDYIAINSENTEELSPEEKDSGLKYATVTSVTDDEVCVTLDEDHSSVCALDKDVLILKDDCTVGISDLNTSDKVLVKESNGEIIVMQVITDTDNPQQKAESSPENQ